jgi:eukaryotic-like serine/threonine-protein kinase
MSLAVGQSIGPYRIVGRLGAGGMGEVLRARDTRLERDVALKVLPERVATDRDALGRFEREAKAIAALSHPNILAIHDFGTDRDTAYAVMELLEGESLRERLAQGALPPAKALEYAVQIAQGLAAAHDKGIVHRDLKPENVFITNDGHTKILDFGLARQSALADAPTGDHSPTHSRLTNPGTILGTMGYMSPEQVCGQTADHRSDIFVFGSVVQEMLTGKRLFCRETTGETMAAILKEDAPDLPPSVTAALPGITEILRHCLEKRREDRFQSARDLAFALRVAHGSGSWNSSRGKVLPAASRNRSRRLVAVLTGLVASAFVGAAAMAGLFPRIEGEPPSVRRLTYSGADAEPSASPDGRLIAFTSRRDGTSRIWIKQLAGGGEAPLTAGPDRLPRFSPDGSTVLFVRNEGQTQSVYRIALVGGEPRKVVHDAVDADWSPDGLAIAFVRRRAEPGRTFSGIYIADAQSGKEKRLTELENVSFFGVRWSPDGRTIGLTRATVASSSGQAGVSFFDAATGEEQTPRGRESLLPLSALAWQGKGNELVLAKSQNQLGNLTAAISRVVGLAATSGQERMLFWASDLFPAGGNSNILPVFDIVGPGRIVFDAVEERQTLREVSLGSIASDGRPLTSGRSIDRQPAYSPDGEQIIFSSNRTGNLDLWLVSTKMHTTTQLTDDAADDWDPSFTPDGRHIVWSSSRSGNLEIWIANVDGSGARQLTRGGRGAENPTVTAGGWVVYTDDNPDSAFRGIWKVRTDGSQAKRLLAGPHSNPEVSPDGRHALAVMFDSAGLRNRIRVVETESAQIVPFEIDVPYRLDAPNIVLGRARWLPDGKSIAFVGVDEDGRSGIFEQDFTPGHDSRATRRPIAGFSRDHVTESFGLSPDGRRVTVSRLDQFGSLLLAEGVHDVEPPRRGKP